jgi:hypothetical protein
VVRRFCLAATLPGGTALPFVISTGAKRSGEICGPAALPWKCFRAFLSIKSTRAAFTQALYALMAAYEAVSTASQREQLQKVDELLSLCSSFTSQSDDRVDPGRRSRRD